MLLEHDGEQVQEELRHTYSGHVLNDPALQLELVIERLQPDLLCQVRQCP